MANAKQVNSSESSGTSDQTYNLISVIYHALQAADTCDRYISDTEGDKDLSKFFREVQKQNMRLAEKGKQMLFERQSGSESK